MPRIIRVVFIIPSLRAGGAERVTSFIAENLDRSKFDVTLLVIGSSVDQAYEIENTNVVFLNKTKIRFAFFSIYGFLRRNKQDIVISSMIHLNTMMALLAMFMKKSKFIGRETMVTENKLYVGSKFLNLADLRKYTLEAMICQSEDMRKDLIENYGFSESKLVVINNPVTSNFKLKKTNQDLKTSEVLNLITIGRLASQKGYDRILNCLSKLSIPFHYTIIGTGPQKEEIFSHIKLLGLEKKITYISYTKNVPKYLKNSDIYLQGSYFEGFPNALLESCAIGIPCVVFEAPGGINEIVQNGINGYIAKDETEFIHSIKKVVEQSPWDSKKINHSVLSKYNKETIVRKFEELFLKIAQ